MAEKIHAKHGRDHLPTGFDPIPGLTTGGGGGTKEIPIYLDTPDSTGSGFVALSTTYGFSRPRRACPALGHNSGVSTWEGVLRVPRDYASAGEIDLRMVADNSLSSKHAVLWVSTSVVGSGSVMDTSYTDESTVVVAIPTTPNETFDQSFVLSTVPLPGASLNVKVNRDASSGSDTLTLTNVLLWEVIFRYTA